MEETKPKWIRFEERDNPGKKTKVWRVFAIQSSNFLGTIGWMTSWRGYAFSPPVNVHTFFEKDCLRGIASFIEQQNSLHKQQLRIQKANATT